MKVKKSTTTERSSSPLNPWSADYTQPLTDFEKRIGVIPIERPGPKGAPNGR